VYVLPVLLEVAGSYENPLSESKGAGMRSGVVLGMLPIYRIGVQGLCVSGCWIVLGHILSEVPAAGLAEIGRPLLGA
jgi:hypothetical protein